MYFVIDKVHGEWEDGPQDKELAEALHLPVARPESAPPEPVQMTAPQLAKLGGLSLRPVS